MKGDREILKAEIPKVSWVTTWRRARIPDDIINKFYKIYGEPLPEITEAVIMDDGRIGIWKFSWNYTNNEVTHHDLEMLLSKLGYPITTIAETQLDFAAKTLQHGAKDLIFGVLSPEIALIGSLVGLGIMIWRAM